MLIEYFRSERRRCFIAYHTLWYTFVWSSHPENFFCPIYDIIQHAVEHQSDRYYLRWSCNIEQKNYQSSWRKSEHEKLSYSGKWKLLLILLPDGDEKEHTIQISIHWPGLLILSCEGNIFASSYAWSSHVFRFMVAHTHLLWSFGFAVVIGGCNGFYIPLSSRIQFYLNIYIYTILLCSINISYFSDWSSYFLPGPASVYSYWVSRITEFYHMPILFFGMVSHELFA
jgi:hypothetical protein